MSEYDEMRKEIFRLHSVCRSYRQEMLSAAKLIESFLAKESEDVSTKSQSLEEALKILNQYS